MKAKVIIEKDENGYSAFIKNFKSTIIGEGTTEEEAKADLMNSIEEVRAYYAETGTESPDNFDDLELEYKHDIGNALTSNEQEYHNLNKTTAIIETGSDGRFSIYISDDDYPYGVIGTGGTVKEAIEDFHVAYQDIREAIESLGETFVETEFVFKYDVPSFLQAFAYTFTLAGLERITGVKQAQLGLYISGCRKPSKKTVRKIETAIHEFSEHLGAVRFI